MTKSREAGKEASAQDRRQAFLTRLGTLPDGCPLAAQVEERVSAEGYVRERVSYETSPGVRVSAFVLIPEGLTRQAPAVLCIHQHNGEYHLGKSEPVGLAGAPEMAYALELCRRGYVTISPDLEGFEERQATSADQAHWSETNPHPPTGARFESFLATGHLLRGSSLQARYVWDLFRAVDYLGTRPEVDAARVGSLGHSLGGQEVCWALLFDRRLRAGVCSCGIGTFGTILRGGIMHNQAAYVPDLLKVGDTDALVAAIAPTPLLMTAGAADWQFPISGVQQIARTASVAYQEAGRPEAYRLREFPAGHGFPDAIRSEAYDWLDRWLQSPE